jgi:hypothetical protein
LLFGEEVKNWANLLPLEVEGLRDEGFSEGDITTAAVGGVANGFRS